MLHRRAKMTGADTARIGIGDDRSVGPVSSVEWWWTIPGGALSGGALPLRVTRGMIPFVRLFGRVDHHLLDCHPSTALLT